MRTDVTDLSLSVQLTKHSTHNAWFRNITANKLINYRSLNSIYLAIIIKNF